MSENDPHSIFNESEDAIEERIHQDIKKHFKREIFTRAEMFTIAARKLAEEGHAFSLAGQITLRSEKENTFWSTDLTKNFHEIGSEDLVRFDRQMNIVEGDGMPNPAVRFHLWIYEQRADVNAIVHTHPPYASALSMLEEELVVAHMDAMMFYEDCAFVADWPGVPVGNSEGELIADTLGQTTKCALLGHHGIIATGKSLEEALYLAVMLENAARMQLLASAAGTIKPVDKNLAREAHDFLLNDAIIHATVDSWARMILANHADIKRCTK